MNEQQIEFYTDLNGDFRFFQTQQDINKLDLKLKLLENYEELNSTIFEIEELSKVGNMDSVVENLNPTDGLYMCKIVITEDLKNPNKEIINLQELNYIEENTNYEQNNNQNQNQNQFEKQTLHNQNDYQFKKQNKNKKKNKNKNKNKKKNKNEKTKKYNQNPQQINFEKIWIKERHKRLSNLRSLKILVLTIKQFHQLKDHIEENSNNNKHFQMATNLLFQISNQIFPILSLYNEKFKNQTIELHKNLTKNFKFEWKNYTSNNNWIEEFRMKKQTNLLIKFMRNSFAHMDYELKFNTNQIIFYGSPFQEQLIFSGNETLKDLPFDTSFGNECRRYKENNCKFNENCKFRHSKNIEDDPRTHKYKGVPKFYQNGRFRNANVTDITKKARTRLTIEFCDDFLNFAEYILNYLVEHYIEIGKNDKNYFQELQINCDDNSDEEGDNYYKLARTIENTVNNFEDLLNEIYQTYNKYSKN
ncbi:ccch zinc finger/tis11-related [Anaeramoeba flamelloides]|uniref:Ccch zinc finger/tis11-related n=1 Tax=Anaeramoeba flamelloides TaxID=1746091 RepID=A0ABQ8Z380_9EUKA|nr:ccch zinc finger/tis11-related [Anaeramoeba flamelloides]